MAGKRDNRLLRLWDVGPSESIWIRCKCGRSVQFIEGSAQRIHKLPSDMLIYDLQYRFRCKRCNADRDFRITLEENGAYEGQERKVIVILPGGVSLRVVT